MKYSVKHFIVLATLVGVVVSAGIYIAYLHWEKAPSDAPVSSMTLPTRPAAVVATPNMVHSEATHPAPLDLSGNVAQSAASAVEGASAPSLPGLSPEERSRQAAIQAALGKMQSMLNSGQRDPEAFGNAIEEVEKANGSPIMGGVNLATLRHNMEVASQMQQVLQQMQALQSAPSGTSQPDGQNQAVMQQKSAQLQALAKQLSTDIVQPAPPVMTPQSK